MRISEILENVGRWILVFGIRDREKVNESKQTCFQANFSIGTLFWIGFWKLKASFNYHSIKASSNRQRHLLKIGDNVRNLGPECFEQAAQFKIEINSIISLNEISTWNQMKRL